VRDQVGREETGQRREAVRESMGGEGVRVRSGWTRRTGVRLLLASLAVHVAVLGWIVWNQSPSPAPESHGPVAVDVIRPDVRDPALLSSAEAPLELPRDMGPVVQPDWIPDAVLVEHGLAPESTDGLPPAEPNVRVAEHPYLVQYAMLARMREPVKRARLRRVGQDPAGTALVVERGLRALASRQDTDGSFPLTGASPGPEALGPVGRTGLALLPFLAEGRSSAALPGGGTDGVVTPGVAWLRRKLGQQAPLDSRELALGLLALSEDYMLSYGRWSADEARLRAEELRTLGERLAAQQHADGSFEKVNADASTALWPLLALDAVRHAGVVLPAAGTTERLRRWIQDQAAGTAVPERHDAFVSAGRLLLSGQTPLAGVTPDAITAANTHILLTADFAGRRGPLTALAASVALYRRAPAAFRDWNRAQGDQLRARLSPSGLVTDGDAVTDTSLVLLALQSAYRAY
jgi:hypothetical protein